MLEGYAEHPANSYPREEEEMQEVSLLRVLWSLMVFLNNVADGSNHNFLLFAVT